MRADALVIATETFFNSKSGRLDALSIRHKVPAIFQYREFVPAGGLMSCAGSSTDACRLAGIYTGRVLKGETLSDLPVQQVTKTELFIDVSTVKALGLSVPQSLLLRAGEVPE